MHRGIEFTSDIRLTKRIKLSANYAFTNAEFEGDIYNAKKIPAVPEHKWSTVGNIAISNNFNLSVTGNYVGERYFISDQANSLPRMAAYFTLDTKLSYSKDNYSAYFSINNLFNEEYYEYGAANATRTIKNYYPSPERNFIIGGSVKF